MKNLGCVWTYGQAELDGVHRMVEGPGKLMLPQSLHHDVLHVLQLVGFPAGATEGTPPPRSCFTDIQIDRRLRGHAVLCMSAIEFQCSYCVDLNQRGEAG